MSRLPERIDQISQDVKTKLLAEVTEKLAALRAGRKTIVLTHGVFDVLHVGVIRHLEQAKKQGDVLVVTLAPDAPGRVGAPRPFFSAQQRAEAVASLQCVDFATISPAPSAAQAIQAVRPDVFVPWQEEAVSPEDRGEALTAEAAMVRAVGGRLAAPAEPRLRSPALIHLRAPTVTPEGEAFLGSLCSRFSAEQIAHWLEKVGALKVLFVGEAIIDEYQYCETLGKSGKEPILAARFVSSEKFAGGILATANQAAAFCDHVGLATLLGTEDSHEAFIRAKLDPKIDATFLFAPGARSIVKRRMVEIYPFQKLFEVYFMDPVVSSAVSAALHARLKDLLPRYDAVVVTDYGHGMLTPEIIELLCGQDRFLAVNVQTNAANQGFNTISKYRRADYVCVSEKELRLEARNRTRDSRSIMVETAERLSCPRMLITQGRDGCLGYHQREGFFAVPAFTNRIVDRIGAGDALLAVTSLCAALNAPMELVGFIGNAVGALAVETVGNRSVVSRDGLLAQIELLLNYNHWVSTS
jgi:cytidyltransferase-like protein